MSLLTRSMSQCQPSLQDKSSSNDEDQAEIGYSQQQQSSDDVGIENIEEKLMGNDQEFSIEVESSADEGEIEEYQEEYLKDDLEEEEKYYDQPEQPGLPIDQVNPLFPYTVTNFESIPQQYLVNEVDGKTVLQLPQIYISDFPNSFYNSVDKLKLEPRMDLLKNTVVVAPLLCPDCQEQYANSDALAHHLLHEHSSDAERQFWRKYQTLPKSVGPKIEEALEKQKSESRLKLIISDKYSQSDKNLVISIPIDCEVYKYFKLSNINLYMDECDPNAKYWYPFVFRDDTDKDKRTVAFIVFDTIINLEKKHIDQKAKKLIYSWKRFSKDREIEYEFSNLSVDDKKTIGAVFGMKAPYIDIVNAVKNSPCYYRFQDKKSEIRWYQRKDSVPKKPRSRKQRYTKRKGQNKKTQKKLQVVPVSECVDLSATQEPSTSSELSEDMSPSESQASSENPTPYVSSPQSESPAPFENQEPSTSSCSHETTA